MYVYVKSSLTHFFLHLTEKFLERKSCSHGLTNQSFNNSLQSGSSFRSSTPHQLKTGALVKNSSAPSSSMLIYQGDSAAPLDLAASGVGQGSPSASHPPTPSLCIVSFALLSSPPSS